jgi:hypothetical protein
MLSIELEKKLLSVVEVAGAYFKMVSQNLAGEAEKIQEKPQSG